MIKCIAFDMDDTLYDEIDYYRSGFAFIAGKIAGDFGLDSKAVFEVLWEIFDKGNRKTTFDAAAEKFGIKFEKSYIKTLITAFRNHKPDITLPSETKQVLTELKKSYKLGMITDGWLPAQEYKVKALGVESFFDSIIYTEKLGTEFWKPSARGYELLLENLNVKAAQAVYVADNLEKDFISPNKMGFKTIRIIRPKRIHNSPATSRDANAQYEIDSISKLNDLLKKIENV